MSVQELALFDIETPMWEPIYHPDQTWEGRATEAPKDVWKAYRASYRCRDCGGLLSKLSAARSCGGGDSSGSFDLCDDCAALDGCHEWVHEPLVVRRSRDSFTVEQLAECSCGWFVLDTPWDGGVSADEVLDAIAVHVTFTHASRWGFSHTEAGHELLVADQAKRRAKYFREVTS